MTVPEIDYMQLDVEELDLVLRSAFLELMMQVGIPQAKAMLKDMIDDVSA